jgi:hypothetical protein
MNFTTHELLASSDVLHNNKFSTSVDPFYIGIGIGLSGGLLIAIIIAHYLYQKKQNMLNNRQPVVFEKHIIVHDLVKTTIDLSV